jgi:uncharacterized protein YxjI
MTQDTFFEIQEVFWVRQRGGPLLVGRLSGGPVQVGDSLTWADATGEVVVISVELTP